MSSRGYRQDAPAPLATTTSGPDDDYDYSTAIKGTSYEDEYKRQNSPQRKSPPKPEDPRPSSTRNVTDDPLLDLEQLEELHEEAERMKALGNKHMASQVSNKLYHVVLVVRLFYVNSDVLLVILFLVGIYSCLQCILGSLAALARRAVFTRLFMQPRRGSAVVETICRCSYRCPSSHCLGAHVWQGARSFGTVSLFPKGL